MPTVHTRNFVELGSAPFDISIAPSSDTTINVEISNSAVEEWNGIYKDIPAVPFPGQEDTYMFGAPIIEDPEDPSAQLFDFSQYPFSITGYYDSAYDENGWYLDVPDPAYFSLPTTKYDIKVTTNAKTVTVSDDFKEIVKQANPVGAIRRLPIDGYFEWSDITSSSMQYVRKLVTACRESNIPSDDTPYFVYTYSDIENPEIALFDTLTGARYWYPVKEILNYDCSFYSGSTYLAGTCNMSINSRTYVPTLGFDFITNGSQQVGATVMVLVDESKLIAYEE